MLSITFEIFKAKHNSNQTRENAIDKHPAVFTVHPFSCTCIFKFGYFEQDSNGIWVIIPMKMRLGCSLAMRDSQIRRQSNLKQEKRVVSTREEIKHNAAL